MGGVLQFILLVGGIILLGFYTIEALFFGGWSGLWPPWAELKTNT